MGFLSEVSRHSLFCMLLASIGALLFGFDNGWWGTILGSPSFLRDYGSCGIDAQGVSTCNLSTAQLSAGSSVQSAGIMVGALMASYIGNWTGRRWSLIITATISLVGVVIEVTSAIGGKARFSQLIVGKTIASISMGLVANIVPIYLSETSPASARGFAISLYQNIQIVGLLISSGSVYATAPRVDKSAYLIPIGVQAVAPGLIILVTPFLPESPRWLCWKGRQGEAVVAASRLFGNQANFDAEDYCAKLKISFDEEKDISQSTGWTDLLGGPNLRRLLIAVGIQCLAQAQGSSYMNNYVVSFLVGAGVTNVFPVIMGLYCLYYVAVLTGHFLPDLLGRRIMVMSTATFCAMCLLVVAIITTATNGLPSVPLQKTNIALIFLWYASFGVQSPLVWIITAESAPTRNRDKVLAVATFWGFGVSLLIASVSPYIQNPGYGNLGSKIGFVWAAFSGITVIWVFFIVPEMKGLSLEQLDYLYNNNVPTRKFATYHFADDILASDTVETVMVSADAEKVYDGQDDRGDRKD